MKSVSSSDNDIDKTFKSKLAEQEFVVPEAFVANMQQKVKAITVAKYGAKFWLLGGFCVIALGAIIYFNSTDLIVPKLQSCNETSTPITLDQDNNQDVINKVGELEINSKEVQSTSNLSHSMATKDSQDLVHNPQVSSVTLDSINQSPLVHKQDLVDPNTDVTNVDYPERSSVKRTNKKNVIRNNVNGTDQLVNASTAVPSRGIADVPIEELIKEEVNLESSVLKRLESAKWNLEGVTDSLFVGNENTTQGVDSDVHKLSSISQDTDSTSFVPYNTEEDTTKTVVQIIYHDSVIIRDSIVIRDSVVIRDSILDKSLAQNKWELQVFGGFSKVSSSLFDTSVGVTNIEKINSPIFGVNLGYSKGNLGIHSGFNYIEYGEKFNVDQYSVSTYDSITYQTIQTMDTVYTDVLDTNGIVIDSVLTIQTNISTFPDDTLSLTTTNYDGKVKQINAYTAIKIPLKFSYVLTTGKWKFVPYLGMEFNFIIGKPAGRYLQNSQGDLITLFPDKFSLSYYTSLQIRREIGAYHLFLEPFYSGMRSVVINQGGVSIKYRHLGLKFGLGVNF